MNRVTHLIGRFFALDSACAATIFLILLIKPAFGQIPTPKDVLGFTPGDDRKLASWKQVVDYFRQLDAASNRVNFQEIGKSTMGAPFVFATISSPQNLRYLQKYRIINSKLADPRLIGSNDRAAHSLIAQGKTIVLITCGIHSTEVGSYLSSMLIAHRLAASNEPEILKILDNTIILLVPSLNPDGVDIVKNWYDKTLGTQWEGTDPPELYHKYVGHDNNRDWYAFTQVETQLTVDKIHNVWHPQIVHDIHQQGAFGSRLFLPPYMPPVEPNVPKQIVEGYTELGNYMAADLRKQGFQGITTNSTYDAWTPARAYSHYHGGVRILSETASARLASPITVKFEQLRAAADDGYDPKIESANFGPVWKGGEWKLRNITDYMTAAAFSLLRHASDNRQRWLSRFYEIGKEAVRPRRAGETWGFDISDSRAEMLTILERAQVQLLSSPSPPGTFGMNRTYVSLAQPYGAFAKALIERQVYPNLSDAAGNPLAPYDVTAHTMPLLLGGEVTELTSAPETIPYESPRYTCRIEQLDGIGLYRSWMPSMDEGWTRWIFDKSFCWRFEYKSVSNRDLVVNEIRGLKAIVFPDQSPNQILNGYPKGSMPDEYVGGIGKEGVENLKKFVEAGGTIVFLNRSSEFAIEQFVLPIRNVVKGLDRKAFYIPGSILRTELDTTHPIARGMPIESIAWFENSPAFEMTGGIELTPKSEKNGTKSADGNIRYRIIARYPSDPSQILLSGWALGTEKIAGKAALVEVRVGKGKIILFGFRPQYRGQSLATFPLFFNALQQ